MRISRRNVLTGGAIVAMGAVGFVAADGQNMFYAALTEQTGAPVLTPPEVHAKATMGEVTLIDIRRPDEWASTGSGEGAHRLDMRRSDFIAALKEITGGDTSAPVAVICARGVRSARLTNQLVSAGFTNIIDVPEGMLGSRAGPGWIARGLPLVRDE